MQKQIVSAVVLLAVLLIALGMVELFNTSPTSDTAHKRIFSRMSVQGITFEYPAYEGWDVREIYQSDHEWTLLFLDSGGHEARLSITFKKRDEPGNVIVPSDIPSNPHGIPYSAAADAQDPLRLAFYPATSDIRAIYFGSSTEVRDSGFPLEDFFTHVIESFDAVRLETHTNQNPSFVFDYPKINGWEMRVEGNTIHYTSGAHTFAIVWREEDMNLFNGDRIVENVHGISMISLGDGSRALLYLPQQQKVVDLMIPTLPTDSYSTYAFYVFYSITGSLREAQLPR